MSDWYNLTAINATDVLALMQSENEIFLYHQMGHLLLIAIFFISFISFMIFNNNPKLNLMYSSGIIAVLSVILRILDLTPDFTPYFCWAIFALTTAIVTLNK